MPWCLIKRSGIKQYYPEAFMAAVLTSDMQNTDKVVTFIEECRDETQTGAARCEPKPIWLYR